MSVIINELEVIVPPPTPNKTKPVEPDKQLPTGPRPTDIQRVIKKFMRRRYRVAAR